jgi:hypothetical protein
LKDHELTPREEKKKSDDDLGRNHTETPTFGTLNANVAPKSSISSVLRQTEGIRGVASARDWNKTAEKATRRGYWAVVRSSGGRLPWLAAAGRVPDTRARLAGSRCTMNQQQCLPMRGPSGAGQSGGRAARSISR